MEKLASSTKALTHYVHLAAAYVRGKLKHSDLIYPNMSNEQVIEIGCGTGLRLHRFKRKAILPRIQAVIGMLKTIQPHTIIDIGSGRGVFLWPLISAFPHIKIKAIDLDQHVVDEIQSVVDGGIDCLIAIKSNVQEKLPFPDSSSDVVTVLEVLEHLQRPDLAIKEVLRVADRFVIASVPSKADNNPGHINLFHAKMLKDMFLSAGAKSVKLNSVLNHIVLLAKK